MQMQLTVAAVPATLMALLFGLVSLVEAHHMALVTALLSVAAVGPRGLVSASPVPLSAATSAIAAVVDGLPPCANPVINAMLSRAADFGCNTAHSTPDVACLCSSRPFKTEAKREVSKVCNNQADIVASRKWAIARCTAYLTDATTIPAGMTKVVIAATANAGPSSPTSSGGNSTAALAEAVFDLDDDEDWTADARLVRPGAPLSLILVFVLSALLF